MALAPGFAAQIGWDTVNPVTKRFQFISTTFGMQEELINANGVTGDRSRDVERIRGGLQRCEGQIVVEPTSLELGLIIPWFMDGTSSGSGDVTYALGVTAAERFLAVDKVSKVFVYDKVAVNRCTISGNQGEALRMTLECLGATETKNAAGTFPALSFDRTTGVFVFTDSGPSGITINGVTCTPKSWTLTLDNHLERRYFNSKTIVGQLALDRTVTLTLQLPYDTVHEALYGAGASGVVAALNHTNGTQKLNFNFPALTFPRMGPDVPGRVEEMINVTGTAYRTGGTSEFNILLNQTP
jgi:hypothetical protein